MGMGVAAGPGVMSMGAGSGLLRGEVVGVSLMGTAADVSSTRVEPELLSTGVVVGVSSTGAGPVLLSTGVAAGKALTGEGPVLLSTEVVSTGAGPTMLSMEASGT